MAKVFYRDEYVSRVAEAGFRHVFDSEKPRRIHDALIQAGLLRPRDFLSAPPLGESELLLVHTAAYLDEIRQPERLARLLMLDPDHPWNERLLEPFLYAAGGTLAAARLAAGERAIVVNLGGGYHHAQADKAEGFCAIADIAIAIRALQRERKTSRTLIVDLDCHHGNGNAEIFSTDESVFTFSIHGNNWCRITKHNNRDVELPSHVGDAVYLASLRQYLPEIVGTFAPDLVMYVAGSDPFVGDVLGDFDITEVGMLARDQFVTQVARDRGLPLVVVTAGGYGPDSWRIHYNYVRWLLTARGLA
jgi:acetoin utilization deacetylase AcuC-like enzyme